MSLALSLTTALHAGLSTATGTPSPSPSPTFGGGEPTPCRPDDPTLCGFVFRITGNQSVARSSDWLVAKPLTALLIIVIALVVRALLHRVIDRVVVGAAEGTVPGVLARGRASSLLDASPLLSERRAQRAKTMGSVLKSITTGIVFFVALLMVLGQFEINLGPLVASAGVVGVALGFGAQTLVKDFLSGIFMIVEDQYGVGDVVDLGEASGTVEAVGLRVTRVRSVDGTVWYVRNGEVMRVGNKSQGWARAVIDVGVAYGSDVAHVREVLARTAHELVQDPDYADLVLDEPEVWGVEALTADSVVVRVVVKTQPLQQWAVSRALRERIKAALDAEGIEIPFAQRAVWVRNETGDGNGPSAEQTAAAAGGA